jgi:hypothetical protein
MKRALILMSGMFAVPAAANVQPTPSDPIVVTGKSSAEMRREAKAYVRQ